MEESSENVTVIKSSVDLNSVRRNQWDIYNELLKQLKDPEYLDVHSLYDQVYLNIPVFQIESILTQLRDTLVLLGCCYIPDCEEFTILKDLPELEEFYECDLLQELKGAESETD